MLKMKLLRPAPVRILLSQQAGVCAQEPLQNNAMAGNVAQRQRG